MPIRVLDVVRAVDKDNFDSKSVLSTGLLATPDAAGTLAFNPLVVLYVITIQCLFQQSAFFHKVTVSSAIS